MMYVSSSYFIDYFILSILINENWTQVFPEWVVIIYTSEILGKLNVEFLKLKSINSS